MIDDTNEMSPGRTVFWEEFYNEEDGVLTKKGFNNKRSKEIVENGSLLDHYEWFITYERYAHVLRECALKHLQAEQVIEVTCCKDTPSTSTKETTTTNMSSCPLSKSPLAQLKNNTKEEFIEKLNEYNKKFAKPSDTNYEQESECCCLIPLQEGQPLQEKKYNNRKKKSVSTGQPTVRTMHVLHVGCGNSNFCEKFKEDFDSEQAVWQCNGFKEVEVLNIDICEELIKRLVSRFPERHYAVGNCCSLICSNNENNEEHWYRLEEENDQCPHLGTVMFNNVDLVFDKGTVDALLSAFAGCINPNMESYVHETLHVLRPGGIFFVVTINSKEVLEPYFMSAAVEMMVANSHSVFKQEHKKENIKSANSCISETEKHWNDHFDKYGSDNWIYIENLLGGNVTRERFERNIVIDKYFELCYESVIELPQNENHSIRIETIGSRYNCFAFKAVYQYHE